MTEETESFPPVAPVDELEVSGNSDVASACYDLVEKLASALKCELGGTSVTQSERWGVILRADFVMPGIGEGTSVNRFVSWQAPDGTYHTTVVLDQETAPLTGRYIPHQRDDR